MLEVTRATRVPEIAKVSQLPFKLSRPVVLIVLCAIVMPFVLPHVGRMPWLLLAIGLLSMASYQLIRRVALRRPAQSIPAFFVIVFYFCGALFNVKPEKLTSFDFKDNTCFHSGLAESLLKGELSLPVDPDPSLLAAGNPYSIPRDFDYVWDASYYKGKYYVYFGIAPVLTTYLPYRLLTQRPLPTVFAMFAYLSAGFIGSLFVLERARRLCGLRLPSQAIQVLTTLLLGVATMAPVMLRRASIYEVCIACAYCFFMWGAYCLLGEIQKHRAPTGAAALASLFMGLSAGSRPTFMATITLLALVALVTTVQKWKSEKWSVLCRIASLLGPFAVCIFLMGLYNRLRFDSWTEFGTRYQLNLIDQLHMRFTPDKLWTGLAYYLFSWPTFTNQYPPIHVNHTSHPWGLGAHPVSQEGVLGLFATAPVSLTLLAAPVVAWHRKSRVFTGIVLSLLGFAGLMLLAVSVASVVPRYQMDFLPGTLLASILTFYALQSSERPARIITSELLWIPAACYTVVIMLVASIADSGTGMRDAFMLDYPGLYSLVRMMVWWN